jgi:peptidoglycan/LPS O-acetylase OafA/YrhL
MAATKLDASRFRVDIEGLRAVAVLGVLAFHSGVPHLAGGYVGVDVFYVISGFLITSLMRRDAGAEPAPTVGEFLSNFYARRIRRILPAAALVLLATLLGAALVQNPLENAGVAGDARATALFYSNIRFAWQASDYFAADASPSPFQQYWSLSLEEQFYFVWPIVFFALLVLARRFRRPRLLAEALAAIVVGSFALSVFLMHEAPIRAFYLLPPRAWELGLGAIVALHAERLASLGAGARSALVGGGLLLILAAVFLFSESTPFPGWTALAPTLGTAAVIAGGCAPAAGGFVHGLLAWSPMQMIGRYSYSLYLWHWPVLVLKAERFEWIYARWTTRAALMLAVTFPAAALTYALVENPARRSRFLRASTARSMALGLCVTVASILGIWAFQRTGGAPLSTAREVAVTGGRLGDRIVPRDFVPRNLVPVLADTDDRDYVHCGSPCVVGSTDARKRIVLFGNSHAGHWGTAFEEAARRLDASVEIHAPGGCASFLIPVELLPREDRSTCDDRRLRVFRSIEADPPEIVVFSNRSENIFASHPAEWERGIRDAIRRVPRTASVLVLAETPRSKESVPLCLARNLEHADRCDVSWPEELNRRLERIATEEGAQFVDLRPQFCEGRRCPAITEDTLIYADRSHLTVPYSRARGDWVATTLARVFADRQRK